MADSIGGTVGDAQSSNYGPPCNDPIAPAPGYVATTLGGVGSGEYGSYWPRVVERLAREKSIALTLRNVAIGSTSVVTQWCGESEGDGTGTVYTSADGGFDPNGYIEAGLAPVLEGSFTERYAFLAWGQSDANNTPSSTQAQYQAAHESIANYYAASGITCFIGLSGYQKSADHVSIYDGYSTAVKAAAASTGSYLGGNVYDELGTGIKLYDASHYTQNTCDLVANIWFDAIVNALV